MEKSRTSVIAGLKVGVISHPFPVVI